MEYTLLSAMTFRETGSLRPRPASDAPLCPQDTKGPDKVLFNTVAV